MNNMNEKFELAIATEDIVGRHSVTEAIELVKTKTAIYLHSNGFWLVSKPTFANNMKGGALYEMLNIIFDWLEGKEEVNPEEKEFRETAITAAISTLLLPQDVFADFDFFIDIATYINKKRSELYKSIEAQSQEPTQETPESIALDKAFEDSVMEAERIKAKASKTTKGAKK